MKNYKLLKSLLLILCSVAFIQCTSEQIAGPAGVDGIDGAEGATGTATCVACHSESHRAPIESSYLMSGHFMETSTWTGDLLSDYGNRGAYDIDKVTDEKSEKTIANKCAICHTSKGYVDYLTTGDIQWEAYTNPGKVSCTTCHDSHGTFDFETDGYDYALRNFEPAPLRSAPDYTIAYLNEDGTSATSNNCVTCHQPRSMASVDADTDGIEDGKITIPVRYGPHYGSQSILLEGILGVEITGSTEYPTSNPHRKGASCVSCHMGTEDGDTGSHTFAPTLKACASCHGDTAASKLTSLQSEIEGLMDDIKVLLIAEGSIDENGDPIGGAVVDAIVSDATWNYRYIYYDHSHGVHNPEYSRALLKNAIDALEARE